MNISPWKNNEDAFCTMFDESIVVQCVRDGVTIKQTLKTFVSTDMTGEEITEIALDTTRENISILVDDRDWAFVTKIERGDLIIRNIPNEKRYTVTSVEYDRTMGYSILARGI